MIKSALNKNMSMIKEEKSKSQKAMKIQPFSLETSEKIGLQLMLS